MINIQYAFVKLAGLLRKRDCKSIVRRYGSEFEIDAPDFELAGIKVNAGAYSNHIKEYVRA